MPTSTPPVPQTSGDAAQMPDSAPGNYYVSVIDGGRTDLLAGPFADDHAAALAMVDKARDLAVELDPKAWFYGFGTVRMPETCVRPGLLNERLGLTLAAPAPREVEAGAAGPMP